MATKLTRRLLAGYPNLAAHDPEGYFAAMIATMAEYPQWAGERAVVRVDAENSDFPPPVPKLRSWLDDWVRPYRFAEEWNTRAVKQIEERKMLEAPVGERAKEDQAPRGQMYDAKNFNDAVAHHGRPIGVFETNGRMTPYRG